MQEPKSAGQFADNSKIAQNFHSYTQALGRPSSVNLNQTADTLTLALTEPEPEPEPQLRQQQQMHLNAMPVTNSFSWSLKKFEIEKSLSTFHQQPLVTQAEQWCRGEEARKEMHMISHEPVLPSIDFALYATAFAGALSQISDFYDVLMDGFVLEL
ncbi:unnamed protein product [Ceratitis capitata]|uniref:(Mediterranean fruit fly) hypothetical protein n=1 Tax=Ceratitis capitata TaxID=7213 RepID=A0A811UK96_CERCA|nr:unnamed protein product [Ceratitis capitata]